MSVPCITTKGHDMRKKLVRHGNSRALVIDKTMLDVLGVGEDDEVSVTITDRHLLIAPAHEAEERQRRIVEIADRIMDENDELFRRLAE
jgi:antitoxin MazE